MHVYLRYMQKCCVCSNYETLKAVYYKINVKTVHKKNININSGFYFRAISVILGEAWRSLPQEEREVFIQGAKEISEEQKLLYPDCWKRKRSHSTS